MTLKTIYFIILLLIPFMLIGLGFLIMMKFALSRNSLTSFECGFDSFLKARAPFSLHFFLIAIIFLVFDLEIIFLLPLPLWVVMKFETMILVASLFIMILYLGTLHELNEGSLDWQ